MSEIVRADDLRHNDLVRIDGEEWEVIHDVEPAEYGVRGDRGLVGISLRKPSLHRGIRKRAATKIERVTRARDRVIEYG